MENNEIDHYLKRLLATMRRPTMPGTQSAHEPHVTASENIDEEPDESVEEQSARYESDEGEEEV